VVEELHRQLDEPEAAAVLNGPAMLIVGEAMAVAQAGAIVEAPEITRLEARA
jgi:hypothetical protein